MPKVCIIGAGPAGSTASLYLSKNKIDHIVIDKAVFPRNIICGEAFRGSSIYWSLKHIDESYFDELTSILEASNWVRLINHKNEQLKVNLGNLLSLSGRRLDFDDFLVQKMKLSPYLSFIEGHTPKNIQYIPHQGFELEVDGTIIKVKILIIATGATSVLPQKLGIPAPKSPQKIIGFRAHYQKVALEEGSNDVYFLDFLQGGYLCILPLNQGYFNILLVLKDTYLKKEQHKVKALFQQCLAHEYIQARFKYAILCDRAKGKFVYLQTGKIPLSTDHLMIAGAAGIAVNPITGFGVGHSMTTGRFAAIRAVEALAANDFSASFLKHYDKSILKKLQHERIVSSIKTSLLKRPKIIHQLIHFFSTRRFFSTLFVQEDFAHNFYNWSYYWRHFWK